MLCPKEKECSKCFAKSFASHPKAEFWDYSEGKNGSKTPHDVFVAGSHVADVICGDCNRPFQSSCNNIFTGFWCPYCNNKTEGKINDYLQTIPLQVFQRQYRPDWLYNPITKNHAVFDFADLTMKTIIELDGDQHFRNIVHWRSTAEDNRKRDLNKMLSAFTQGFSGLRIYQVDVWEDKHDWRVWIIAALNLINSESAPIWVFPKQTIYDSHIDECKKQGIRYTIL
jgi:very-short-patch-repair endonuclease